MRREREACHAAAVWWSEFLTQRPGRDNGDESVSMGFAVMMEALIPRQTPTPEQITVFIQSLEEAIWNELEAQRARGWARPSMWLSVDYGPDAILDSACAAASVNPNRLPWKTCMWLDTKEDGITVKVAVGYGASITAVWPKCSASSKETTNG